MVYGRNFDKACHQLRFDLLGSRDFVGSRLCLALTVTSHKKEEGICDALLLGLRGKTEAR